MLLLLKEKEQKNQLFLVEKVQNCYLFVENFVSFFACYLTQKKKMKNKRTNNMTCYLFLEERGKMIIVVKYKN